MASHTIFTPASDSAEPALVQVTESTPEAESIEQIMDMSMPNPLIKIKDYCLEKGLDFEIIKTTLQTEVDNIK